MAQAKVTSRGVLRDGSQTGCNPPSVVEKIVEPPYAVAPWLLGGLEDGRRASCHRLLEHAIDILDVDEVHGRASWIRRTRFAQHYERVADLNLSVFDGAIGRDFAVATLSRAEDIAEETHQTFDILDDDVRIDAVVAVWRRAISGQVSRPRASTKPRHRTSRSHLLRRHSRTFGQARPAPYLSGSTQSGTVLLGTVQPA
jgi:hypothetical protein